MSPCLMLQMTKASSIRATVRNELFPTADMVVSMSKEFGVPFTTEDFEGIIPQLYLFFDLYPRLWSTIHVKHCCLI